VLCRAPMNRRWNTLAPRWTTISSEQVSESFIWTKRKHEQEWFSVYYGKQSIWQKGRNYSDS
jgi:hypothetical protein